MARLLCHLSPVKWVKVTGMQGKRVVTSHAVTASCAVDATATAAGALVDYRNAMTTMEILDFTLAIRQSLRAISGMCSPIFYFLKPIATFRLPTVNILWYTFSWQISIV